MWNEADFKRIREQIGRLEPQMVEMQRRLVALPAMSPVSGGGGERAKVDYLGGLLRSWGLEVAEYRAPDNRVPCGHRPSLTARLKGRKPRPALWLMTHLDVVPPGPRDLWQSDPFEARVESGRIYGRGTEDNQQEMVASCYAVRALLDLQLIPQTDVVLMLVADEENGSDYGVGWLLENHDLCRPEDLVVVPDAGNEVGTLLEVAEKSIAWVKFTTLGRQAHGSTPHHGNNAHRAGANLLLRLDQRLHEKYNAEDKLFSPPVSTLEPTKKEENVPNINTIPAEDVFYFDCRVLPQYQLTDLVEDMKRIAADTATEFKVEVKVEQVQMAQAAPPTSPDASVVRMLANAVREVYGGEPFTRGIGGGTVAALFRRRGIPAVVWGRNEGQAHKPNEFSVIANMVGNAAVYAHLMGQTPA
ncbi:M20 family metallo-hydrolase [candidate division WOR-3 bacterium]|uniref:M20 family metallo-hydrolase n=1 Tax=candidate division WOR-3 bacterium TaxID=2052148 RepID=A0A937XJ46_UNCW3|nr:M20 family metallo-hydrolase [candidate division WOR-3 bacterium]